MKAVHELDKQHQDSSILRPMAPRIQKLLGAMNMYNSLIGTLIGYSGPVAGLVAGAFQCILSVGRLKLG